MHAAAAFTAAQRALANPATSRALAAGIHRAGNAVAASSTGSPPPSTDNGASAPPSINFGRVAAAAQAFSPPPKAANPPTHRQPETAASGGLVPQKVR